MGNRVVEYCFAIDDDDDDDDDEMMFSSIILSYLIGSGRVLLWYCYGIVYLTVIQ